jgi:hypothetical protein
MALKQNPKFLKQHSRARSSDPPVPAPHIAYLDLPLGTSLRMLCVRKKLSELLKVVHGS